MLSELISDIQQISIQLKETLLEADKHIDRLLSMVSKCAETTESCPKEIENDVKLLEALLVSRKLSTQLYKQLPVDVLAQLVSDDVSLAILPKGLSDELLLQHLKKTTNQPSTCLKN